MNEEEIITLARSLARSPSNPHVVGIGDDAAVIPNIDGTSTLVSTDLLTESVHFYSDRISARELGYKTLAVNLSDIAAMGGRPESAFLSMAIPTKFANEGWIEEFFSGFFECANEFSVTLLGGDTTKSIADLFVSVTVIGKVASANVKLRSTARPGDLIAVTGTLGDSLAGFMEIECNAAVTEISRRLICHHHRPRPHVPEGIFLGSSYAVSAMMDISDGLVSDVSKIMDASGYGATFDLNKLPLSSELHEWSVTHGKKATEIAAVGGEDYCLLFTIRPTVLEPFKTAYDTLFPLPFTIIGTMTEGAGLTITENGAPAEIALRPFSHFD